MTVSPTSRAALHDRVAVWLLLTNPVVWWGVSFSALACVCVCVQVQEPACGWSGTCLARGASTGQTHSGLGWTSLKVILGGGEGERPCSYQHHDLLLLLHVCRHAKLPICVRWWSCVLNACSLTWCHTLL